MLVGKQLQVKVPKPCEEWKSLPDQLRFFRGNLIKSQARHRLGEGMNVVIVDSNDDFLNQLLELCRGLDFQVESYHSAEQFEHALAGKPSADWD